MARALVPSIHGHFIVMAAILFGLAGCHSTASQSQDKKSDSESLGTNSQALNCLYAYTCGTPPMCRQYVCKDAKPSIGVEGYCSLEFASPGVSCNDSTACTTNDVCKPDGSCGGTLLASVNDNNACTTDVCNPSTGQTTHTAVNVNDNNACTTDACNTTTGAITHTAVNVNDNNACTTDTCNTTTGAVTHTAVNVNDGNPCTTDACNRTTGAITHTAVNVNDNNACTKDSCNPATGQITHVAVATNDNNPCTADSCDPALGVRNIPLVNNPCNDGNSCTDQDHCSSTGACVGVQSPNESCGFVPPAPPIGNFQTDLTAGETKEVGTIAGSFAVSSTGAATYSMSFELPPGRAGMTPSLGLAYSSDQGNGQVGTGFSLSGLSSIRRCPKTLRPDGVVREVRYDADDKFCLNGMPLVEESPGSGIYHTVPETFSKVVAYSDGPFQGPSRFVVWSKDGHISYYGTKPGENDLGARILTNNNAVDTWSIRAIEDRSHNSIVFQYGQNTGSSSSGAYTAEQWLTTIWYDPHSKIDFSYEERPDKRYFYRRGMKLSQTVRLNGVQVYADGEGVRQYIARYEDNEGHPSGRSRLLSLTQCTLDEPTVCKPSTHFTWNNGSKGFFGPIATNNNSPPMIDATFALGDWNGDGLQDTFFTGVNQTHKDVTLDYDGDHEVVGTDVDYLTLNYGLSSHLGSSWEQLRNNTNLLWTNFAWQGPQPGQPQSITPYSRRLPTHVVFDYDGDQRDDIIVTTQCSWLLLGGFDLPDECRSNAATMYYFKYDQNSNMTVHYMNGIYMPPVKAGFLAYPQGATPIAESEMGSLNFLDMNGDGMQDMVQCWPGSTATSADVNWLVYYHQGTGYDPLFKTKIDALNSVHCNVQTLVMDENGDGRQELVFEPKALNPYLLPPQPYKSLRQVSGTGTTTSLDLVDSSVPTDDYFAEGRDHHITVPLDVNGDGLTDILASRTNTAMNNRFEPQVFINTGAGFNAGIPVELPPFMTADKLKGIIPIEWNGDGAVDILIPEGQGGHWFVLESDLSLLEGASPRIWRQPLLTAITVPCARSINGTCILDPQDPPGIERGVAHRSIDWNGDGYADLIGAKELGFEAWSSNLDEEDTLKTIDDGLRSRGPEDPLHVPTFEITYGHLVDDPLPINQLAYPLSRPSRSMRVVRSYSVNNGLTPSQDHAGANGFYLSYSNGVYDRQGEQFLGFKKKTTLQELGSGRTILAIERYDNIDQRQGNHYPSALKLTSRQVHHVDTDFTRVTSDRFQQTYVPVMSGASYYVYDQTVEHEEVDTSSSLTQVSYRQSVVDSIDSWGNVTSMHTNGGGSPDPGLSHSETYFYDNDTSEWLLGKLTHSFVCENSSQLYGYDGCGVSTMTYDGQGRLESITLNPNDPSKWLRTTLFYDEYGNKVGATSQSYDNTARSSWVFYDERGWYPTSRMNALGHVRFEKYHPAFGTLTQSIDPNGAVVRTAYDRFGRLSRQQGTDGIVAEEDRKRIMTDDGEILTRVTSTTSLGQNSESEINNQGLLVHRRSIGFHDTVYQQWATYDEFGRVESQTALTSEARDSAPTTRFAYDILGRTRRVVTPDGKQTSNEYAGLTSRTTDPKGHITQRTVDTLGRVTSVIDGFGTAEFAQTTYLYGAFGSVSVTSPGGVETIQGVDWQGNVYKRVDPSRGTALLSYTPFGELEREANDMFGVRYTHDLLGRITSRISGTEQSTWVWDQSPHGIGQLSSTLSADGHQESFTYDTIGRSATMTLTPQLNGGSSVNYTTSFEYNQGRISKIFYPHVPGEPPLTVGYEYDERGLMVAVRDVTTATSSNPGPLLWNWKSADSLGHPMQERFGNGLETIRRIDPTTGLLAETTTQVADLSDQALQHFTYGYDDAGNLDHRTDERLSLTESFEYDPLDRLTKATVGSRVTTTSYWPNGNVKTFVGTGESSVNWAYDPAHPHAVQTAYRKGLSHAFTYDALGRQITRDGQTISYTSFHKPKHFGANNSGSPSADLTYDANGNRVTKWVAQGTGAGQTLYVHQLYERFTNLNNQPFVRFFVQNLERTFLTVSYNRDIPPGSPWQRSTIYTHPDNLGSPTLLTDATGQVLERRSYDAFGLRRSETDWISGAAGTPDALQVSGFTEHEDDEELGLVNMQGRIYDPLSARFLTPDPIVQAPIFSQSWNRYSYVFNNPLRFTDPSGFEGEGTQPHPLEGAGPYRLPDGTDEVVIYGSKPDVRTSPAENGANPYAGGTPGVRVGDSLPVDVSRAPTYSPRADQSPRQRYALDNYGTAEYDRYLRNWQHFYTAVGVGAAGVAFAAPMAAGATLGEATVLVGSSTVRVIGGVVSLARTAPSALRTAGSGWVREKIAVLGCLVGGPCSCFAAGTVVWTSDGPIPIEEIAVGSQVLSRDAETGEYSWQPVTKLSITPDKDVYSLDLALPGGGIQSFEVTQEHPFWVEYRGWVPAAFLREGDHVSTADAGGWASVQSMRGPPRRTTVYNFEVANTHSYFVGERPTWVHNGPCGYDFAMGLFKDKEGNRILEQFAEKVAAKTYGQIYGSWWPGSDTLLEDNIMGAMEDAQVIRYNLQAFDMGKFQKFLVNPVFRDGNFSNWELYTILTTPELLAKTVFYNGIPPTLHP